MMDLPATVQDCLRRHGLEHTTGVVAVSGGPDSVALAHMMLRLLQNGTIGRLILAHVNHQLRGHESDADEDFVRSLPGAWQEPRLSVRSTRINISAIAWQGHENGESIARRERYRWLTDVAREERAAWVATGHTANDQAETVLFRLLRGSGLLGLSAMPECRPLGEASLIRPLLSAPRTSVLAYLEENRVPYRVDASNRELRYTRNRLRLELLPLLEEKYNPAIVDVLCRLADQARELHAEVIVDAARLLAAAELPRAGDVLVFSLEQVRKAPANQVREMFRLVWQREGWPMGDMDFDRWQRLVDIIRGSRPAWEFPGSVQARRVGPVMQLEPGGPLLRQTSVSAPRLIPS